MRDGRGELASCSRGLARKLYWDAVLENTEVLRVKLTLGETGTEDTGDLLDQGLGSDEGIVLASKLLDELLVLVQLLEIVGRHGVDTTVLGTVDIVLVTKNATARLVFRSSFCLFSRQTYQIFMLGRGIAGSLMVPEKRLSRWGS